MYGTSFNAHQMKRRGQDQRQQKVEAPLIMGLSATISVPDIQMASDSLNRDCGDEPHLWIFWSKQNVLFQLFSASNPAAIIKTYHMLFFWRT